MNEPRSIGYASWCGIHVIETNLIETNSGEAYIADGHITCCGDIQQGGFVIIKSTVRK